MNALTVPTRSSWLSLVAETAGVPGTAIARVLLSGPAGAGQWRAVVQVKTARGQVVGAAYAHGEEYDLALGASVDIGFDVLTQDELHVVAWLDDGAVFGPARAQAEPAHATSKVYEPGTAVHLFLKLQDAADSVPAAA